MTGGWAEIGELQERAARAIPAAVQEHRHGCWLRCTDSTATWWAGAALMHGRQQTRDLATTIADAEEFYAAHGAPARFQVCPACPADLDDALAGRGYRRTGPVTLRVATTSTVLGHLPVSPLRVDLEERPSAEWFDVLTRAHGLDADRASEWRLLHRVDRPSAYATAFVSGRPVAVGRAVDDTGWAGVFGLATRPEERRRGAAGAVLAALAHWVHHRGTGRMYLQVSLDSPHASALYRRAGFEEACRYHYRTAR